MQIKVGLYKRVFIFNKIVIKVPRIKQGIGAILSEQYGYIKTPKKYKQYLLPIYFIPFIPITIQRKVEICSDDMLDIICDKFLKIIGEGVSSEIFYDIKPCNFGYYKGDIVKIDYDFIYYIHNYKILFKERLNKFFKNGEHNNDTNTSIK